MRNDIFNAYFIYIYKGKWKSECPEWKFDQKTHVHKIKSNCKRKSIYRKLFRHFRVSMAFLKFLPIPVRFCFALMLLSLVAMILGSYLKNILFILIGSIVYLCMAVLLSILSEQIYKKNSIRFIKKYLNDSVIPFKAMLAQFGMVSKNKLNWILNSAKKNEPYKKLGSIFSFATPFLSAYLLNSSVISRLSIDSSILVFIALILSLTLVMVAFFDKASAKATAKRHFIEDLEYLIAEISDERC